MFRGRDHKFRAWDRHDKVMIPDAMMIGNFGMGDGSVMCTTAVQQGHELDWMEFTGAFSKKSEPVYEADLIAFLCPHCEELHVAEVKWISELATWGFDAHDGQQVCPLVLPVNEHDMSEGVGLLAIEQVVGNIIENPELLGASNV